MEERIKQAFKSVILDLKNSLKEKRELEYEEGSFGITSLLYCPLKTEFKNKYPQVEASSNAIDDGYIFENVIEPFLEKNFKGKVIKDASVSYQIDGFNITGHPDFVIEREDEVIVIEFKAPIFLKHSLKEIPEDEIIFDEEDRVHISSTYILQAQIQKKIVEEHYKKPVRQFLFIKSLLQLNGKMQKVYVVKPVKESITEQKLREIVNRFLTDKSPRYSWECSYCIYKKEGICEGKQIVEEKTHQELDEETISLLEERKKLFIRLNEIENTLKGRINGQVKYNGKDIGWVQTKVRKVDYKEAYKVLGEEIFDYLMLISSKRERFYSKIREKAPHLLQEKITKYWKL